jgi:enterochelin esterase-like enzyme
MARWDSFSTFLQEALAAPETARQAMVNDLLAERPAFPWVEGDQATFVLDRAGTRTAALNLDTIQADPPFAAMENLKGTTFWYVTRAFAADDLLDYMIAIDDPMTPLAQETDIVNRVATHWGTDALNPQRMETAQMNVSVLRMPQARPFPDWAGFRHVPRGKVSEHRITSDDNAVRDRVLWVYTPNGYDSGNVHPLLLLLDGQWALGPLQIPHAADALIKHGRMQPTVIAMLQSAVGEDRNREYIGNAAFGHFLVSQVLPLIQTHYDIDSSTIGIGGVDVGAVAAIDAALTSPALFNRLMMISPPLGKGAYQDSLRQIVTRLDSAAELPARIFHSVGRYEAKSRFLRPSLALRDTLQSRRDIAYQFAETGSGHGLVGFRGVIPEALVHLFPGATHG